MGICYKGCLKVYYIQLSSVRVTDKIWKCANDIRTVAKSGRRREVRTVGRNDRLYTSQSSSSLDLAFNLRSAVD